MSVIRVDRVVEDRVVGLADAFGLHQLRGGLQLFEPLAEHLLGVVDLVRLRLDHGNQNCLNRSCAFIT